MRKNPVGTVISCLAIVAASLFLLPGPARADTGGNDYVSVAQTKVFSTVTGDGGAPVARMQPGSAQTFPVSGVAGVPSAGVAAIIVVITASNTTGAGTLKLFPSGSPLPTTNALLYNDGHAATNTAIVPTDSSGQLTLWNGQGTADTSVLILGYFTSSSASGAATGFSTSNFRLVDTRNGTGVGSSGALTSGTTITVPVAGVGGIPTTATKVLVNLSSVNATGTGTLRADPTGPGGLSSVDENFNASSQTSNLIAVALGSDGGLKIKVAGANTDVMVDVEGYFVSSTGGTMFYSDESRTYSSSDSGESPLAPGETRQVYGRPPNPAATLPTVALNVSVSNSTGATSGGVRVWATGTSMPSVDEIPVQTGQDSNLVFVTTDLDGLVNVKNTSTVPVNITLDSEGYFAGSEPPDDNSSGGPQAIPDTGEGACSGEVGTPGIVTLNQKPYVGIFGSQTCTGGFNHQWVCVQIQQYNYGTGSWYNRTTYHCSANVAQAYVATTVTAPCAKLKAGKYRGHARGAVVTNNNGTLKDDGWGPEAFMCN